MINFLFQITGRVSTRQFISAPSLDDAANLPSLFPAVPPEEVLFRRINAPTRYEEHDIYFANEHLPPNQTLPNSDFLKAIHTYTSDFYANATMDNGRSVWSSMDETALLALGFLLEETAVEALGETGDMVFVEGEEVLDDGKSGYESEFSVASGRRSVSRGWDLPEEDTLRRKTGDVGSNEGELSQSQTRKKRRRLSESGRSSEKLARLDGD